MSSKAVQPCLQKSKQVTAQSRPKHIISSKTGKRKPSQTFNKNPSYGGRSTSTPGKSKRNDQDRSFVSEKSQVSSLRRSKKAERRDGSSNRRQPSLKKPSIVKSVRHLDNVYQSDHQQNQAYVQLIDSPRQIVDVKLPLQLS